MNIFTTQATTIIQVSDQAEKVINLGRRHHWRFRIIPDFQGVIDEPVYNSTGDWLYMPLRERDKAIIPKAAFVRHAAVEKAGFRVAQVIIGHEIKVAPEVHEETLRPSIPTREIDWRNVAEIAGKGLLIGMMGIAMVSFYALTGALQLVDPSYCIVLSGEENSGNVIELIRWNTDVQHGTNPLKG